MFRIAALILTPMINSKLIGGFWWTVLGFVLMMCVVLNLLYHKRYEDLMFFSNGVVIGWFVFGGEFQENKHM